MRDWASLLLRAAKGAAADDVPMLASAIAYNAFLAIPAMLLLVVGLYSLVADASAIAELTDRLGGVMPQEAVSLLEGSLVKLQEQPSTGLTMTVVGLVLALLTTTGALTTVMTAVNRAHGRDDRRGFMAKRLVALVLAVVLGGALLAVSVLLVLGPHVQHWIGDALDAERTVSWIWWTLEWPVLLVALFAAVSAVFALSAEPRDRRWRAISAGAAVAVVLCIVASAAFGMYASGFGSYNKTWGSLSAAIVTMIWLWLVALGVLFGSEVDAELERSRAGEPLDVSDIVGRTSASPLRPAG